MIIDGYTSELLIDRAIGGTTLEESVKALQDVFYSTQPEPMIIDRYTAELLQIQGERDTAIAQLSKIGKELGERMDDVAKIVRCRDCKWWNDYYRECESPNWNTGTDEYIVQPAGMFCGWGERRTDADD